MYVCITHRFLHCFFFFYLCCRFYIHEKKYITYDCNVYKSQFPSIYIYISFFISCQDLRVRQHLPDNLRGDREVPGSLQASPLQTSAGPALQVGATLQSHHYKDRVSTTDQNFLLTPLSMLLTWSQLKSRVSKS